MHEYACTPYVNDNNMYSLCQVSMHEYACTPYVNTLYTTRLSTTLGPQVSFKNPLCCKESDAQTLLDTAGPAGTPCEGCLTF